MSRRRLLGAFGGAAVLGAAAVVGTRAGGQVAAPDRDAPSPAPGTESPRRAAPSPTAPPEPSEATEAPDPEPTAEAPEPLPAAAAYEPLPGEFLLEARRLAGAVAAAITTYPRGSDAEAVAARAAADDLLPGHPPVGLLTTDEGRAALAASIAPLVDPGAESVGEVVYPQSGGATATSCSFTTVVRQTRRPAEGDDVVEIRTIDLRLALPPGGDWGLEGVASTGGDPVSAPTNLSAAAQAVLDDDRIALPDTCRWDVLAGRIDERLLTVMARMADVAPYAVTVLSTAHPHHVFGTDRVSNHTPGRGVDIWEVDGQAVVAQQPSTDSAVHRLMTWLHDGATVPELGGPWDLDEPGAGRSFTNDVHRDHVHVAFYA